jgi:hypothetical protein
METASSTQGETQPQAESTSPSNSEALSPALLEAKDEIKGLLAEARQTREMLAAFVSAVETGTYSGGQMMSVAKGMAFLDAILRQNNKHIHDLQERLK